MRLQPGLLHILYLVIVSWTGRDLTPVGEIRGTICISQLVQGKLVSFLPNSEAEGQRPGVAGDRLALLGDRGPRAGGAEVAEADLPMPPESIDCS